MKLSVSSDWYDSHSAGLGDQFIEEVLAVFDSRKAFHSFLSTTPNEEYSMALSKAIPLSCHLRSR